MGTHVPPKRWYPFTILHDVTSQKAVNIIPTAMRPFTLYEDKLTWVKIFNYGQYRRIQIQEPI
jgi:hypothetical protein